MRLSEDRIDSIAEQLADALKEKKMVKMSGIKEQHYPADLEEEDIEQTILRRNKPKDLHTSVWSRIKILYRLNKDPFSRHNPNK